VPAGEDRLRARGYRPRVAAEPAGALVFFHGGGWVLGDLETHDHVVRALANASGHLALHVDYRLAPEHPFPAPRDDAVAVVRWARDEGAALLGIGPARVAVGGDSAGGNLAALAALAARGDGLPPLRAQVLAYPALDPAMAGDSHTEFERGPGLTRAEMEAFWGAYLGEGARDGASPLAANLAGVAPAAIAVAGLDPLRDDGLAYAEALRAAGIGVEVERFDDMIHGFIRWAGAVDRAHELHAWMGARVRAALA
jgi:acetyl esterase